MSAGHTDNRLDSWRTGALVLAVALAAGFATARLMSGRMPDREPVSISRPLMGTLVTVSVPAVDDPAATAADARRLHAALDEVARVDSLFTWRQDGAPIIDDAGRDERRRVLATGLDVLRASGGAFDPRVAPLVRAWGFDEGAPRVPDAPQLRGLVADLRDAGAPDDVDELADATASLHFGAWAKGYAVDRAVEELMRSGQSAALVNAGGEVRGYGRGWTVGVQDPRIPGALLERLAPGSLAVATSGDYEQCFERDGRRYHHLLDPRTGYPAEGCRSVTVLAPTCARADALATAVFVLGPVAGLDLIENLVDVEALIIDANGRRHDSSGLDRYVARN